MKTHAFWSFLVLALTVNTFAQDTKAYQPGEIRQKLEKLNVLGSVLYVAAHPDDENTRLIAFYANEKLMRTAYLSATRGDGGQNLIGPEIREELGLIRTQELLAARRTDGGQQFFSRANDFGYSKNPDETFNIWDREKVLADFVWTFRKFRPDVVITRFNSDGRSHGHHTASAILAREAFELSGDPNAFPDQLDYVDPWQPKKIFWNTGWWWFRDTGGDTTNLKKIDVGQYNPLLGESYPEIAARSRSMHKSQGFGSTGSRGEQIEYLEQWGGEEANTPFEGIDTSWGRVEGAKEVSFFIDKAIKIYDERNPQLIIEPLMGARKALESVQNDFWKEIKKREIEELIVAASGLYIGLKADQPNYAVGDSIQINMEVVNRSDQKMLVEQVKFDTWPNPIELGVLLPNNKPLQTEMNFLIPNGTKYAHPYWLREKGTLGMYTVNDQEMIGKPENDPAIKGVVSVLLNDEKIHIEVPVVFKRTDPVEGEVTEPLTIGPPVMVNISGGVLVFGDDQSKSVDVRVIAGKNKTKGNVTLDTPDGWKVSPAQYAFDLNQKGEEQIFTFSISPPASSSEGNVLAKAEINGRTYTKGLTVIDYDHIPKQTLYPDAKVKVVKVNLKRKGNLIGYIDGAGDAIPENLSQIGYQVESLAKDDVSADNLKKYDAVILGIRAFNTVDWLSYKNSELFEYVKQGGNLIIQYNTSHRLVTQDISPYSLKLSRDRVAVEEAPVEILAFDHPVMKGPNRITEKDFEGWVQERGLYFPNEWGEEFTPILKSNDPGESPKTGGLLVAKYGGGYYVYSGYSWFRELPAGVPGAYRIFVNLISLGK
ncbi:N-acetylglucosaminyl deacetylase, LmbE family [Ekhidna lutea]|uniref:N-acetylglucosaminyl deacetylase, LmbE family n=1 Tax=Ekhidna lutea TaxID=447679 RepID=A0A239K414_EKHLU|nr:PIG-L family deacetylase [Ekhidna lutea]SNT13136.1 N-acetylglucosaminyl deacetylase, LmbE family [Ekhidna lutea]